MTASRPAQVPSGLRSSESVLVAYPLGAVTWVERGPEANDPIAKLPGPAAEDAQLNDMVRVPGTFGGVKLRGGVQLLAGVVMTIRLVGEPSFQLSEVVIAIANPALGQS